MASMVRAGSVEGKGRVVETVTGVAKGWVLESSPALELTEKDRRAIDHTSLFPYYFVRAGDPDVYIIFGLASFCSHADEPNARVEWRTDQDGLWADLTALQPIEKGEEVTLRYGNIEQYDTDGWVE